MQYRRFGRTELPMPVFSCGGMRYVYTEYKELTQEQIPDENQQNLEATIRRSLEVGINHIETARMYGTSEMQLGAILPKLPREKIIVQTKVTPTSDSEDFRHLCDKSLGLLNLDYIDLLTLHGINNYKHLEDSIRPNGCLDVARQLQAEGKVKFIGFSTHAATDLIIKTIETNQFDYVNLHWYYINQFNWPAIEAAKHHDMGVFIISPSDKGGMLYKPPQKLSDLCHPLSPMVFNDLFCLSHPQVDTLSLGASKPSDFDEHLKVIELLDRADEILPPILNRLEKAAIATLGKDWYRTWHIGLPHYSQTPGEINIPVILWLRNLAIAFDMFEYAKRRYNHLNTADPWFPGFTAEKVRQFDLSDCLRYSPHADKIPALLEDAHRLLSQPSQK
ncbi:aldo/keto reductase [Nostoc sp. 'Peltigera malacea cyanobiont' DB3992]|uniref:aldo/keto reductase n=1 Tax=Nostoc sp. 'Peltigera malacea cyanobiont' DB3992 TaxID=1206980 RepID=UPI000C043D57|nr:aldo/keto reductase [Nostoc sp. 'Peltigera malacea cyanobiont' DB3992]PHM11576.1 aldo/keto reductase [Nostoc sp. 'Peltigera malacea cyanobiont' DB3992]